MLRRFDGSKRFQALSKGSVKHGPLQTRSYIKPFVYALIFCSKLPNAKRFQRWVFSEVLPSIRKTGQYRLPTPVCSQVIIMNETDFHYRAVAYLRRFHSDIIIVPGLGEM